MIRLVARESPDADDDDQRSRLFIDVEEAILDSIPNTSSGHRDSQVAFFKQGCVHDVLVISVQSFDVLANSVGDFIGGFSALVVVEDLNTIEVLLGKLLAVSVDVILNVLEYHCL